MIPLKRSILLPLFLFSYLFLLLIVLLGSYFGKITLITGFQRLHHREGFEVVGDGIDVHQGQTTRMAMFDTTSEPDINPT